MCITNKSMGQTADVMVIGGGIIGLTSAYFLAKAGLKIEVFDQSDFGREASWAGAGMIPPGNPMHAKTPIDCLRAVSSQGLSAFSLELKTATGIDNGYRVCGGIEFLHAHEGHLCKLWSDESIAFEELDYVKLLRLEPAIGNLPGTAVYLPDYAQVRNPWHLRALIAACQSIGVRLVPNAGIRAWVGGKNRITGVRLSSGEIRAAGQYVIAAGAWAESLLSQLHCSTGVHPVRGQIVLLRTPRPVLSRLLLVAKRYLVPRGDGRVLVGSTEEPEAGFEKRTTAAAIANLITFATTLVPVLRYAEVETCWAGLRPGSPDGMPFIGRVPGWENVFAATGHYRAGVQLSLGTAQLVTDFICKREPFIPPAAFQLDREPNPAVTPIFRS
jgi:glycine oxidase